MWPEQAPIGETARGAQRVEGFVMSLQPGIHVFYTAHVNGVTGLNYVRFDGRRFVDRQLVAPVGLPALIRGASAALLAGRIYIYCTCDDYGVHQLAFDGETFFYQGNMIGVASQDETATVIFEDAIHVFYRDRDDAKLKHLSQQDGIWTGYEAVASDVNFGPTAVVRGRSINLAYCDREYRLKMVWFNGWRDIVPMSSENAMLINTPSCVLLGSDIYVMHHCWDSRSVMYCGICDDESGWLPEIEVPGCILSGGPAACVYGDRIFCFTQGTDNTLYGQMVLGGEWQTPLFQVKVEDKPIQDVWWSPCAVAV